MRYRKLRIAWSVAWGAVAVLLCVLWVRSYWWIEQVYYRYQKAVIGVDSMRGTISFFRNSSSNRTPGNGWWFGRYVVSKFDYLDDSWFGLEWSWYLGDIVVGLPYWLPVTVIIVLVAIPWLSIRRFSLRALLIATTPVAVGLGLIVWFSR